MVIYELFIQPEGILFLLLSFLTLPHCWSWIRSRYERLTPTNWPIAGMLPELLRNYHHIHEYATNILRQCGGTFEFKGPWFANANILVTSDPANIHHILSRNFSNYPKGPQFKKIFDILGDGIFNADSNLWEAHRKTTMSLMNHAKFRDLQIRTSLQKVETGLVPVMEHFLEQVLDLQEVFQRFSFDVICILILGYDPGCLSVDFPNVPCEKAIVVVEEALLYRHVLPERFWRLQKWLQLGKEKKLTESWAVIDQFLYSCISSKHDEIAKNRTRMVQDPDGEFHFLKLYTEVYEKINGLSSGDQLDKFLRDTTLNLMIAGRDTTSAALTWFFWLLAKNPHTEIKIREEIEAKLQAKGVKKWGECNIEELGGLVYLHGALCESLRLFPSVALEHKTATQPEILPSGHLVDPNTKIVLSFYSMGRMEAIWGKDFLEFKPERWISERERTKHIPSFKFPAFNAGPRTCLGKEMAFTQMKIVACTILQSYQIQVVEGHPISPSESIILHMKHGLKVRITRRSA